MFQDTYNYDCKFTEQLQFEAHRNSLPKPTVVMYISRGTAYS